MRPFWTVCELRLRLIHLGLTRMRRKWTECEPSIIKRLKLLVEFSQDRLCGSSGCCGCLVIEPKTWQRWWLKYNPFSATEIIKKLRVDFSPQDKTMSLCEIKFGSKCCFDGQSVCTILPTMGSPKPRGFLENKLGTNSFFRQMKLQRCWPKLNRVSVVVFSWAYAQFWCRALSPLSRSVFWCTTCRYYLCVCFIVCCWFSILLLCVILWVATHQQHRLWFSQGYGGG